jgi:hypothetical protein
MPQVLLHSFRMGDVDDPYLYAAFPIAEWQKTEHGAWCMQHAVGEPTFYCNPDPNSWGFRVTIMGELSEPNITYLKLRWGQ